MEATVYERRRLGRTELQVPVLGIGGAHLGRRGDRHHEQVAVDTVLSQLGGGNPTAGAARAAGVTPERLVITPRLRRARWMYDWCAARALDLHLVNLHFCLREKRFASILIGFSTPERVAQNIAAYRQQVDPELWDELEHDWAASGLGA